jgi:hypothetical protein
MLDIKDLKNSQKRQTFYIYYPRTRHDFVVRFGFDGVEKEKIGRLSISHWSHAENGKKGVVTPILPGAKKRPEGGGEKDLRPFDFSIYTSCDSRMFNFLPTAQQKF